MSLFEFNYIWNFHEMLEFCGLHFHGLFFFRSNIILNSFFKLKIYVLKQNYILNVTGYLGNLGIVKKKLRKVVCSDRNLEISNSYLNTKIKHKKLTKNAGLQIAVCCAIMKMYIIKIDIIILVSLFLKFYYIFHELKLFLIWNLFPNENAKSYFFN